MDDGASPCPITILLVEDHLGDVRLVKEAFNEAGIVNELRVVRRGEEAMDLLHGRGDYADDARPDIVLTDLSLPGVDGADVVAEIKDTPALADIPVIVVTGTEAFPDAIDTTDADAHLTKPIGGDEFLDLAREIGPFGVQLVEPPSGGRE